MILFVDSCPRGEGVSRTLLLAEAYLTGRSRPVERVCLPALDLRPMTGDAVARREALIDRGELDAPEFALARAFARADEWVVAAPFWDFSFPSMLKVYVEHVFVRNIVFHYGERGLVPLTRARRMTYLTTSGSPIGASDFGAAYFQGIAAQLGVSQFERFSAEGLDLEGADVRQILADAISAMRGSM